MQGIIKKPLAARNGRFNTRHSGFALLITITLLSFLVLLLVSLASLTRVETQVASNNQQITQARQNALAALNIAIGELQKYAGPDQRTTARADLDASLINDPKKNGRWTGVYGSRVSADYADTPTQISGKIAAAYASASGSDEITKAGSLPRKGSQAILLNWLVSGNESKTGFSPSGDVAGDGHITLTETPVTPTSTYHKPSDMPAGETVDVASVTPSGSQTQALLVGAATASAGSDWVSAPLVKIQIPESNLPGFASGGTGTQTVGRYAWWVGDEGIKANVNLASDTGSALLPPASPANAFVTAQRTAVELVDKKNPVGSTATFNSADLVGSTAYDATGLAINRLVSVNQLPALAEPVWNTARKLRFHDLTATSQSVLSDTYAGGLKKDLSAILATGASSPADSDYLFVPFNNTGTYGLPTWGKLRSYARTTSGTNLSDALTPRLPTTNDVGIYPVMTLAEVGFEYIRNATTGVIQLAIIPRVALWNPYTRPIAAADYEFGFTLNTGGLFQLQGTTAGEWDWTLKPAVNGADARVGPNWENIEAPRYVGDALGFTPRTSTDARYLRFTIRVSQDIPPGESHTFVKQGLPTAYDTNPSVNVLTKGSTPAYFTIDTGVTPKTFTNPGNPVFPATEMQRFRVRASTADDFARNFHGNISTYLGKPSPPVEPHLATWPPLDETKNSWYQAYIDFRGSGAFAPTPATPLNTDGTPNANTNPIPSPPFLQDDRGGDYYGFPYDLQTAPGANRKWGALVYPLFVRERYLVQSNPIAPYASQGAYPLREGMYGHHMRDADLHPLDGQSRSDNRISSAGYTLRAINARPPIDSALLEFRPENIPLLSIGQLQHANLSYYVRWPIYLIGNSNAPSTLLTAAASQNRENLILYNYTPTPSSLPANTRAGHGYDAAYLVNRMLWDRYFVSTVPSSGTSATGATSIPSILPNPRHVWQASASSLSDADKRNADTVAAHLMLKGGFNINSTSEQAWRAVLGGVNQLSLYPNGTLDLDENGTKLGAALSRFSAPPDAAAFTTNNADSTQWAFKGYRRLNQSQIAILAASIVQQIRSRGPFVSMGDFVNRRLRDNPDTTAATVGKDAATQISLNYRESVKGTLQEAIDTPLNGATSVNNQRNAHPFRVPLQAGWEQIINPVDIEAAIGGEGDGTTQNMKRVAPYGAISANAPQFLTQADILSAIGSGLSARSDTFSVRTYGETQNPVTGEITGRAWCEAVVQRTIDPVIRKNSNPASPDYYAPAAGTATTPDLGRRFKIISFRWLSSNDI
jgi:Tfp pilus assembly protein PilX